jgi:CDGSH iron-sulfur domain-containing protein 3
MSDGKIADTKPCILELGPGTYYYCSCGYSKGQPFCDGSHSKEAPGFEPIEFVVDAPCRMVLCACKHTKTAPKCDGTHKHL